MFARLLAGFAQAAGGVAVGAWGYARWHWPPSGAAVGDTAQAFVHGASSYLVFLFATPLGWLALWLFVEGVLRVLASAMEQPLSTLPVGLVRAARGLRPAPKLPPDLVQSSEECVIIESARDYDWHGLSTVDVEGTLYCVVRESGSAPRPHRYRLTPIAHDHVVRTVTRYAPTSGRGGSGRTGRPPRR